MRKRVIFVLVVLCIFYVGNVQAQGDVEVSNTLLKVSLKEGEKIDKSFSLSTATGGDFALEITGIKGVRVNQPNFVIEGPGEKEVTLNFDSTKMKPGVYVGAIRINKIDEKYDIPIVFEIETKKVLFDSNLDIPPIYSEIERGGKLVYQTKVFDLTAGGGIQEGLGPVNVDIEFKVIGIDGKTLISKNEQILVNKQVQVSNTISFPEEVSAGTYVLTSTINYQGSIGAGSQIFTIKESGTGISDLTENSQYSFILIIGIALIFLVAVIFLFIYLLRERDKVLLQLRDYNAKEIRNVKSLLLAQQKILEKRKVDKIVVRQEVSRKIEDLKVRQKKRVDEINQLRVKGNVKEMQKKIDAWKSQGYETSVLDYKMRGLSTGEMGELMKKWKKNYNFKSKPKNIKR